MEKGALYKELSTMLRAKQLSLDMTDCPYTDSEQQMYREGWNNAFMWAIEVLSDFCK